MQTGASTCTVFILK